MIAPVGSALSWLAPSFMLPDTLPADHKLDVALFDGRTVRIPLCTPQFERWHGPPLEFRYGNKPLVSHAREALWAEFKVMSLFREAGWDAFVVQTYGCPHFLREQKRSHADRGVPLPAFAEDVFRRITDQNGGFSGFFDVCAGRGSEIVFAEMKLSKRDELRPTQVRWIASALAAGVPTENLLIVEWTFSGAAPPAPR